MTNQHTPGPWTINKDGGVPIIGFDVGDGGELLPIVYRVGGFNQRVANANARLIAAAPALLAALTELHRLVEVTDNIVETSDRYGIYHNDMMDALDAAEVAIKQARGE